jgi:excisionase family DNA binding protein
MISSVRAAKSTTRKTGRKMPSLEGALLRALPKPARSSPTSKTAPLRKTPASRASSRLTTAAKGSAATVAQDALDRMARHARALREQLAKAGLVHVETVRLRPQGSVDRRLIVEFAPDPEDSRSVLLRVTPATALPLPAAAPAMLTTQQAADRLNVSRPYVVQLVDGGRFKDVQRTQSGHRRIPLVEVERIEQEMRAVRHAALDNLARSTRAHSQRELSAAKAKAKRRWVVKPA